MEFLESQTLKKWINQRYLRPTAVEDIRQSIIAKPVIKYAVLDDFFVESQLDALIDQHRHLEFDEVADRAIDGAGNKLPYDGAVVWANQANSIGAELFFCEAWHRYCAYISGARLRFPLGTEVKLRWHRAQADGFWVHTDSTIRSVVMISYFNRGWTAADGGLLQLWRVDEGLSDPAITINAPTGRMDFLSYQRIRTSTPGGGFSDNRAHDLTLLDQIVPTYNRLFICNFQDDPAYHSVTPSNGKERTGFVQWLLDR